MLHDVIRIHITKAQSLVTEEYESSLWFQHIYIFMAGLKMKQNKLLRFRGVILTCFSIQNVGWLILEFKGK